MIFCTRKEIFKSKTFLNVTGEKILNAEQCEIIFIFGVNSSHALQTVRRLEYIQTVTVYFIDVY